MFGYRKEISTEHILDYWDLNEKPEDTNEFVFIECLESEKPECWQEPLVIYKPSDLKSWAMSQIFAVELLPHNAAFVDFANIADQEAANQFRTYGSLVGQGALVETIIAKAIELGANI